MLIDSHAHLDAPYLKDHLPAVLHRAREAGVRSVVTIGVTPRSSENCLALAKKFRSVHAAAGYHPHWARKADAQRMADMERLVRDPSIVAVGEIGLDYFHFHSPREAQLDLFHQMLDLAAAVQLPIIIHDRDAHDDVYRILDSYRSRLVGGVIHCFSGNWDLARKYLDWGFYLSVSGKVTYSQEHTLIEVARKTPLDRLLLETDAPNLTPASRRGKRNEPAFLRLTAETVASLRRIPLADLGHAVSENVLEVFRLKDREAT